MAIPAKFKNSNVDDSAKLPHQGGAWDKPFYLALNKTSWEWNDKYGWLPRLHVIGVDPGVNGVSVSGRGKVDDALLLVAHEKDFIVLKDREEYLTVYETAKPGAGRTTRKAYVTKWETPEVFGSNVEWETDDEALAEYIASKVGNELDKVCKPIPRILAQRHTQSQSKRVDRLQMEMSRNPNNKSICARYERENARLEAMKASLEQIISSSNKKPKLK